MKKNSFLIILFSLFYIFSFPKQILAEETIIYENPTPSTITYGEHLYKSELTGGLANVEGFFLWKNDQEIPPSGTHERTVIFTPTDSAYNEKEITLQIIVKQKKVFLTFDKELNKQYDESTNFSLPNYVINGIVDSDTYVKGKAHATAASSLVGTNIPLLIEGLSIEGEHASNYYLDLSNLNINIYPKHIENLGTFKRKITFIDDIYVSPTSTLVIEPSKTNHSKKGYTIKDQYAIYLKSDDLILENVKGKVNIKVKLDTQINSKKTEIYNYYNNKYEKVDYTIDKEGYLVYTTNTLGELILMEKKLNLVWLYICFIIILITTFIVFSIKAYRKKPKILKYKSMKRGSKNGNN